MAFKKNLFTWNDLIVIKSNAPSCFFSNKLAVVCGMEQIRSEKLSRDFNLELGNWLYTVEFGDGSSIEVPECYLEKYQASDSIND